MGIQVLLASRTHSLVLLGLKHILRQFKLYHIQHSVRVAGKHTGAGCPVHGLLASLAALTVVMAIDNRHTQFCTDLVKLVAEVGHLVRAVLVAGDDFINGVNHNGYVVLLGGPAYEHRSQFVHRPGLTTQVPDINVFKVVRFPSESLVHIPETVQTAGPIQLQIHIQDSPLGALPSQPLPALRNGYTHLNLQEGLSGL